MERFEQDLRRYAFNLFAYPQGYIEERTANDLGISESVRTRLIQMQSEFFESNRNGTNCSYEQRRDLELQLFSKEFNQVK